MMKLQKKNYLMGIENLIDYHQKLKLEDKNFKRLMFLYSMAIRELETKIEILKDEFKLFYEYDLIDHITTRIKEPKSIINKMEQRKISFTYQEMIKNINDIAGLRIICPLKRDIFTIKDLLKKWNGIEVLKEKDYVTHPKKSGYSSYHLLLKVPVTLSKNIIYVKVEVQIRTIAMDFWANLEHKMKYKPQEKITNEESNEWIYCAKMIHKLDHKMINLNE